MTRVKWTDNVCTVGGTCIHGYFTGDDLAQLFTLCPEGFFTPTYYHERLPAAGYECRELNRLKELKYWPQDGKSLYDKEYGYYFIFMEEEGQRLLNFLKERFPMIRGEACH